MSDSIIYLFTSARKSYHKRDILNISCYPENAEVTFAYSNKWIPENLREVTRFKGKQALVSFCEYRPDDPVTTKFHPVRWVTIQDCKKDHGGFSMILKLGKFQNYSSSAEQIELDLANFQEKILGHAQHPASGNKKACFVMESSTWSRRQDSNNWIDLAEHLRKLFALRDSCFFQINDNNKNRSIFAVNRINPATKKDISDVLLWEFTVKAGTSQNIELISVAGSETEIKPIKIELSPSLGQVIGPLNKQFSEGITSHFKIDLQPQLQKQSSIIRMHVPFEGNSETIRSPSFEGILTIKPRYWELLLAVVLFSIAPIVATISQIPISDFEISGRSLSFVLSFFGVLLAFKRLKIA